MRPEASADIKEEGMIWIGRSSGASKYGTVMNWISNPLPAVPRVMQLADVNAAGAHRFAFTAESIGTTTFVIKATRIDQGEREMKVPILFLYIQRYVYGIVVNVVSRVVYLCGV